MKNNQVISIAIIVMIAGLLYQQYELSVLSKRVSNFSGETAVTDVSHEDKITSLRNQIAFLQNRVDEVSSDADVNADSITALQNAPKPKTVSQDDLLTSAVENITPSVVSIVISKAVEQLEVVYQNPFGDDPFFRDLDIRIPTYRSKGTEIQKVGSGSGFVISSSGLIITNKHVVQDTSATFTALLADGTQHSAEVLYRAPNHDIAILRINGRSFSPAQIGQSQSLKLGQSVIAIGNALGEYSNSVSIGIVSGLGRTISAETPNGSVEVLDNVIQTDAAINPGNSGGPLINTNGEVIGVNVATVQNSDNISFAIPIDDVIEIVKDFAPNLF